METQWVQKVGTTLEACVLFLRVIVEVIISIYKLIVPTIQSSVNNKIVMITGAAHGIGKELAFKYGRLGATIVSVDINSNLNEETVSGLKKTGIKAHYFTCNIADMKEVFNLATKVHTEVGPIDILVNNAGILHCKSFLGHSPDDIEKTFNVNIISHFWVLQAFLPNMIERKSGHIVAISSAAGLEGISNAAAYSATKFAIRGLMESLGEESRANGWGIKTTTIYPIFVNTGMCKEELQKIRFPSLFGQLESEKVAEDVISAQRRGLHQLSIPRVILAGTSMYNILPHDASTAIKDFVATGIIADSSRSSKKD